MKLYIKRKNIENIEKSQRSGKKNSPIALKKTNMEIEIINKTARAFLMEERDALVKKMVEEFNEKFPNLSSWQVSARIRTIIAERIKEGKMPDGYLCDRATIANSMKRQGLYITKK